MPMGADGAAAMVDREKNRDPGVRARKRKRKRLAMA
jgi:hypothetical protein